MDKFTEAYLACALWAEIDENDKPLDANHTIQDFAPEALLEAEKDCKAFQQECGILFLGQEESAGHDFWLTRNHHGAGFWDGDWEDGEVLTEESHKMGEKHVYTGDDGKLYFC